MDTDEAGSEAGLLIGQVLMDSTPAVTASDVRSQWAGCLWLGGSARLGRPGDVAAALIREAASGKTG